MIAAVSAFQNLKVVRYKSLYAGRGLVRYGRPFALLLDLSARGELKDVLRLRMTYLGNFVL